MNNYKKQIALSKARIEQVKAAMHGSTKDTDFYFVVGEQMVSLDYDNAVGIANLLISNMEKDILFFKTLLNR